MFLRKREEGEYVVLETWISKAEIHHQSLVQVREASPPEKHMESYPQEESYPQGDPSEIDRRGDRGEGSVRGEGKGGKRVSRRRRRFQPPTLEDLEEYCSDAGYEIDCARFLDYYAASGWRLSNGNPMKDWQAAVRTWVRSEKKTGGGNGAPKTYDQYMERIARWPKDKDRMD